MEEYSGIMERVEAIRSKYMVEGKLMEYDQLPDFGKSADMSSKDVRKVQENLTALLVVYGETGIEWSISPLGQRLIHRQYPRRSWYHKHEYVEILYVIEGTFKQILLGEERQFERGEFVITDQNCEHADVIEAKDAAVLFLQIRGDYLEQLLKSYDGTDEMQRFLFHALWRQQREQSFLELSKRRQEATALDVERLLENLLSENLNKMAGHEQIEKGFMIRLLHYLCQEYSLQVHTDSKESREKAFLYELECYIRIHAATVTVKELEEQFHYHRNYYHTILKKYRNRSFQQYVIEIRMKYARQLLEQTTMSMKDIAHQVGYENVSHFYHLFKEFYKKAPRDFRGELDNRTKKV